MAPVPGYQFNRLLRAMDAGSFERFVADLWRARGWSVERAGDLLVAEDSIAGRRVTLEVRAAPRWRPRAPSHSPGDAHLVVVNRPVPGDANSTVDADDLHEMVRYAVDPATRDELFDAHLNRSGSPTGWAIRRVPPVSPARLAVAVASAVVLVAAAAGGLAVLPGDEPAAGLDGTDGGAAIDVPDVEREAPDAFAATQWPGGGGGYPPGAEAGGIIDPAALASTHADRVGQRPYELTLTVREFEAGRPVGAYEEQIAVRSDWTFATSVDASGDRRTDHPVVSAVEMYSAGNGVFVHVDPDSPMDRQAALQASPGDVAGIEKRVERYLAETLSLNETEVVETNQIGDATFHRVNGTGTDQDGGAETVSALVTAGGTVHEVRTERNVAGTDRSVVVTLEYRFGSTTVTPPPWLGNDSATVGRNLPLSKR